MQSVRIAAGVFQGLADASVGYRTVILAILDLTLMPEIVDIRIGAAAEIQFDEGKVKIMIRQRLLIRGDRPGIKGKGYRHSFPISCKLLCQCL